MFSLTIARMPSAASSSEPRPIASATDCTAVPAASTSSSISPPSRRGGRCPTHDVRVRHGRVGAALAVRGRPRLGARRLRPDPERLRQLRDMRDRAAAGTDRVHVHRRHAQTEMRDGSLAADRRLPGEAERHIRRRTAHVEREDVVEAGLPRHVERARDPSRRAREHTVDRVAPRLPRRHQARVRAQDVHVRRRADALQVALQLLDVGRDARTDVRVHARRQSTLVLTKLRQHMRRQRDRKARIEPFHDRADLLLVPGRDVRVDEGDRQRLHAGLDEVADHLLGLRLVDRHHGLAASVHTLHDLARVGQRRRRIGLDHDDPPRQRPRRLRTRQMQDLREPPRRQQPHAGTLRLQHRVRRHRRPMQDVADLADLGARLARNPLHPGEHALRRIGRRRRRLHAVERAGLVVDEQQVGERTPDVHSQSVGHSLRSLPV